MKIIISESQNERLMVLRRLHEIEKLIPNLYPYQYPCDSDSLETYMMAIKTEMFGVLTLDWFENVDNDVIWDVVTDFYRKIMVNNYIKRCGGFR